MANEAKQCFQTSEEASGFEMISHLYKITEVKPNIFLVDFKNYYDMAMHFLRYQEFYESPSPKFKGKSFTIINFMEWYSKDKGGGMFTYPRDWGGFNIPGNIITKVWEKGIGDTNKYDTTMFKVASKCKQKSSDGNFYLIGAIGKNAALKHEIAHGFFYTIPEYKKEMTKLVKELKPAFRKSMEKTLKELGYCKSVYIDECQAYLSTGLSDTFKVKLNGQDKPFISLYKKYYNAK